MKVAIIFVAVIVGCLAQSADDSSSDIPAFVCDSSNSFVCAMKEILHNVKHHGKNLGNKLLDVGTAVLTAGTEQAKNLLVSGGQAVLKTVTDHLAKSDAIGKRAVLDNFKDAVEKGKALVDKVKGGLKSSFEKAVGKIMDVIKNNAALKIEKDTEKKVDDAVEEFKKEGKTGFKAISSGIYGKLKDIIQKGMEAIMKLKKGDKEKRALFGDLWESAKGHLSNLSGSVSDAFKPHLDALTDGLKTLGDKAKEHAGNLVDAAKDSFNDLKTKVGGHIDKLKGHASDLGSHATNALAALKEAVASIASQALSNSLDTVKDAVKTGSDAAKVVADHVSGN